MAADSSRRRHWCEPFANQFISPLVILSLILVQPSVTQLTFGNAPITTIPPTSTKLLPSQSPTLSTSQNQLHSPTSSSSTPTNTADDSDDLPPSNVVNYYFLLLAVLVLIVLALLWTFHRRRKRNLAISRNGRQGALAQDLEGWGGNRRWAAHSGGRGWRNVFGGHGQRREGRGEGDSNERGEAPPPYEYVSEQPGPARVILGRSRNGESNRPDRTRGYGRSGAVSTSIPLHVLNESGEEGKPPEYGRT